ncbi:MAG: Helicase associated domain protein, partial [Aristaeellaceae bacterium]
IPFRPTVSPIIYKQQIGRALTAGGSNVPLILDVVNNVEGLYSIDSIGQEMLEAAFRLRSEGQEGLIVREGFQVIDQVKDCRELFEQLEGSLHIEWEEYYQAAVRYREEHGNLLIPQRYVTEDGKCLGRWLVTQRRLHQSGSGSLTGEQALRLEALGMVWDDLRQFTWESCFAHAQAYYQTHGDLQAPQDYVTEDGCRLGQWLSNLRTRYRELRDEDKTGTTLEQIQRLEAIGMTWNTHETRWDMYFAAAERYYREHGHLLVPRSYQTQDGLKLGVWIANQRSKRKQMLRGRLTDEQTERLNRIGMVWDSALDEQWMRYYAAAKTYFEQNGNLRVSKRYETADGLKLGVWVVNQRQQYQQGKQRKDRLNADRVRLLNEIGMQWKTN